MYKVLTTNVLVLMALASTCVAQDEAGANKRPKVVVAVIDTGIDKTLMSKPWVCNFGNRDFTDTTLNDVHGHGTHIAGIIEQYAKGVVLTNKTPQQLDEAKADFCIVVLKYYDEKATGSKNMERTVEALKWAVDLKVDVINYSGGGVDPSYAEKVQIMRALKAGIKVVAAAGNERSDIDKNKYYPAMYDAKHIIIVGNLVNERSRSIASSSNYGASVNSWEVGTDVFSRLPTGRYGYMTGTSQATAVKSGKIVREMLTTK